ncbi:hypothetical protein C6I21_00625 [Alkalicoccus urumqiensis]|uniref:DUF4811 domain-containing protein n=2 Tax=Alkalicoccus urumqiensis TaxID=1548213 RepID=A0A2P6MLF1_ALKUR|nr:hypothetical protein C6I21_00625 [Alkalicoccus urumqiensis]
MFFSFDLFIFFTAVLTFLILGVLLSIRWRYRTALLASGVVCLAGYLLLSYENPYTTFGQWSGSAIAEEELHRMSITYERESTSGDPEFIRVRIEDKQLLENTYAELKPMRLRRTEPRSVSERLYSVRIVSDNVFAFHLYENQMDDYYVMEEEKDPVQVIESLLEETEAEPEQMNW